MIVVSDASPLTSLAAIGHVDLLRRLYGRVLIPPAVQQELAAAMPGVPGFLDLPIHSWIEVVPVSGRALLASVEMELDLGEAEAIVVAVEQRADLLLIDERRGRLVASRLGVKVIGVLGVLVNAKRRGFIPAVKPLLDDLIVRAGFWISQSLYARVLAEIGEQPVAEP